MNKKNKILSNVFAAILRGDTVLVFSDSANELKKTFLNSPLYCEALFKKAFFFEWSIAEAVRGIRAIVVIIDGKESEVSETEKNEIFIPFLSIRFNACALQEIHSIYGQSDDKLAQKPIIIFVE